MQSEPSTPRIGCRHTLVDSSGEHEENSCKKSTVINFTAVTAKTVPHKVIKYENKRENGHQ